MDKSKRYIPFENDTEMIETWLDYSKQTIKYFPKPSIDKHTAKFVLYTCEMLELEKDVFFMTIDMISKYTDIIRKDRIKIKDPILTILTLILISNKLVGQRSSLTITSLCVYLRKTDYKKYTKNAIENLEIEIMQRLQYDLPISSTMDEMNLLIEVFIKPEKFMVQLRKQCLNVLSLVYLHTKTITDILDDIYMKTDNTKMLLKTLYENKLYIPSGVVLGTVMMCNGSKLIKLNVISNIIADFTKISEQDLNLVAKIIHDVVSHFIQMRNGLPKK